MSNRRADAILADATNVLQTDDGGDDVACDVKLRRRGNVTKFNSGDGSIDNPDDFRLIMEVPGDIKVVDEINWCGDGNSRFWFMPKILGCAPIGGKSLAVVRHTSNLEGILWAHEYGHNKGLAKTRTRHRSDSNALMYKKVHTNARRVSRAECGAFQE